ncbi:MAG: hypothetical protein GYA51_05230 [Candidatus Methanofastidiosa archaeon]|nr:hypothetical protein [Candidatus Methanofastidiosa archaeon]
MKKIFAMFISIVFVVASLSSVSGFCDIPDNVCFGVCLSCSAGGCSERYCIISGPSSVQVGDTVTVTILGKGCDIESDAFIFCDQFEVIDFEADVIGSSDGCDAKMVFTLRALEPGVLGASFSCNENKLHITITPKEYPMANIMKIIEKNKNK